MSVLANDVVCLENGDSVSSASRTVPSLQHVLCGHGLRPCNSVEKLKRISIRFRCNHELEFTTGVF